MKGPKTGTMPRCARLWLPLLLGTICAPLGFSQSAPALPRAVAGAQPLVNAANLNVAWTPLAPQTLTTAATGSAGGRILSVAVDPADQSGNTVYLGTTGGVWKSTNAAAGAASVVFTPITDRVAALDPAHMRVNLLSIGAVSVQPGGTGVVLAGTGDPTSLPDSLYGTGILRSADGGNSWSTIGGSRDPGNGLGQNSFFGEAVSGFAWSTTLPNLVVAAVSSASGAYAANAGYEAYSAMGLYYSQDAGQTWQIATITDGPNQELQGPGQVSTGVAALAVVWNPVRRIFVAAMRSHGFYQSPDGITWTRLANQPGTALSRTVCPPSFGGGGSTNCPIYQAGLAVQPGTGDMFAMATSQTNADSGLWQDVCAAVSGSCATPAPLFAKQIGNATLETSAGTIAGASHALWLTAIPSGSDTLLFAGTQDLFRCSLAAGCVWRNATHVTTCDAAQVGPMQHSTAWVTGTATLLFANDRGLWRSRDAMNLQQPDCSADDATHFDNLNATLGPLAEVTGVAQDPANPTALMVGEGAMGVAGGSNGAWQALLNGPGAYTAAGWGMTAGTFFATSGAGVSISACSQGAQCGPTDFGTQPVIGNAQVSGDGTGLSAPAVWVLDPGDPGRMLVATCRVWRGLADGTHWGAANALSGMLDGTPNPACQGNTQIRALAATGVLDGRGDSAERLYAGLAGFPDGATRKLGHLLTALVIPSSTVGSTTWYDLTGNSVTNDSIDAHTFNPGGIGISAIAIDPTDRTGATLYVGLSGYGGNGFAESSNVPVLYGSVDAGQHWANITGNLPNAPVNAVLVDPEDPAIVYVATDVGAFATTSISQCLTPSNNCWGAYGTGLPAVKMTTLSAVDTSGEKWLRIGTKGRGIWQTELASTVLQNVPATATLLPATVNFATQAVGTTSSAQTLTIQNTGTVALTLGVATVSSSDFVANDQCPATLSASASCTISVVFAPTTTGTLSASLTVVANVQGGVLNASFQGTGTPGGVVVLTPLRLDFGDVRIGQPSYVQYLTVANTGTASISLRPLSISGPFAISADTCGLSLATNTSCTVGVIFKPVASGATSGTLVATDDAGTQTAVLSGIGQSGPTDILSPLALTFSAQALGTTSAAQQVTLTNNGDSPLTGIAVQTTGDFAVNNVCGSSLPAHSTCAMQVVFSPQALGAETGQLTVQDQFQQQSVSLHGVGSVPASGSGGGAVSSPLTMNFGIQGLHSLSAAQTLTIINNGGTTLSSIAVAASQQYAVANNACAVSLAPGASCTVGVTFAPQTTGTLTGTVQISADGLPAPLQVPLAGMGADFQLQVQGTASSTITGGSTATYQLLLTPVGASAGTVNFTCSGAPAGSTCSANPINVTMTGVGTTATIQVTITTVAQSSHATHAPSPWGTRSLAGAALASVLLWRRRGWAGPLRHGRALVALGILCLGLAGCGLVVTGGKNNTPSPGTGSSDQGVYTVTVGGTAPGLSHDVTLQLTVQ